MEVSTVNEHGVLEAGHREVVASKGRSYAAITIGLREDGRFSYGIEMNYSYGGFLFPISINDDAFPSMDAAGRQPCDGCSISGIRHFHRSH